MREGELVREKAERNEYNAGECGCRHNQGVAQGNVCLAECERECYKEAKEHGQEALYACDEDCGDRLACLVELLPEGERFDGVSAKTGGEKVVEKVTHGSVGVVCFERNIGTLHRKSLPAVSLNDHDKSSGD